MWATEIKCVPTKSKLKGDNPLPYIALGAIFFKRGSAELAIWFTENVKDASDGAPSFTQSLDNKPELLHFCNSICKARIVVCGCFSLLCRARKLEAVSSCILGQKPSPIFFWCRNREGGLSIHHYLHMKLKLALLDQIQYYRPHPFPHICAKTGCMLCHVQGGANEEVSKGERKIFPFTLS